MTPTQPEPAQPDSERPRPPRTHADPTPAVVSRLVRGVTIGLLVGVVLGLWTGRFALWLPITVAVGILVAGSYRYRGRR